MADKNSDKIFKNTIRNEAYEFLKNEGFKFYDHSRSVAQMTIHTPIATKGNSQDLSKKYNDGYFSNIYSSDKLLELYGFTHHDLMPAIKLISPEETKKLKEDFLVHCYKKYPEYQKSLLGHYSNFKVVLEHEITKEDFFFYTIDLLANTKKEKAQTLAKFPIGLIDVTAISLNKIESYLKTNGFTEEEFDKYILSFIKARKNQLKDPKKAEHVKDYLIGKYQDDKLMTYCEFFPFLKSLYTLPPVDFIYNKESLSTVIIIECKKMKDSFLLSGWDTEDYQGSLKHIVKAFVEKYDLSKGYCNEFDKSQKIEEIIFLHDNAEFNKQIFEQAVTKYFRYMNEHVDTIKKRSITSNDVLDYFNNWLPKETLYNKLLNDMPNKDTVVKKKI